MCGVLISSPRSIMLTALGNIAWRLGREIRNLEHLSPCIAYAQNRCSLFGVMCGSIFILTEKTSKCRRRAFFNSASYEHVTALVFVPMWSQNTMQWDRKAISPNSVFPLWSSLQSACIQPVLTEHWLNAHARCWQDAMTGMPWFPPVFKLNNKGNPLFLLW